jgi:NAD+ synthase (glutamine-hydrolysing)
MRVLAAQLNPIIGDFEGNTRKIIQTLDHARLKQVDLVVFSELVLCGYPPEDLLLHSAFIDANQKYLEKVVQASMRLMVVLGVVRRNPAKKEKPIFNSAAIIQDGKLLGFEDKQLLPTYDVFDERRYFEPGTTTQIWEFKGKKIGVMICEDIWQHAGFVSDTYYAHDPVLNFQSLKPDIVLNLSSSPYQFQKPSTRVKVCAKCAKTLNCPVILCCQVGANDQLVFDGYSLYVNREGQLVQMAKGFEEDEMIVDLDAPANPCAFSYDPIKDLYQALVLGVRDYFHKQGFKKGCFGLSGGIDSALVACIAADALGRENVLAITMPSRYSSVGSVTDSEVLARNLGIELFHISIEKPFQSFLDLLQPYFQGKVPDITEENMQARIRGMILMAISNKHGYIVMSTGNKSEMALGYCTLYGDMAGGLGVISDVTKQQVYILARWLNREKEIIPQSIIDKVPSAELRSNQKDTDSLPTYDIVDKVLQGYVEEYLTPEEIAQKYHIAMDVVLDLVRRIHRAEYKRRQAPPGIRVTKKAFNIGRRYPIVQGWR